MTLHKEHHDITKLPKWAQSRITVAERNLAYCKEQERRADHGNTDVRIRKHAEEDIGLAPGSTISFVIEEDGTEQGRFDVSLKGNRLEVMGVGRRMSDSVRIRPRSTNLFYVELTPWEQT